MRRARLFSRPDMSRFFKVGTIEEQYTPRDCIESNGSILPPREIRQAFHGDANYPASDTKVAQPNRSFNAQRAAVPIACIVGLLTLALLRILRRWAHANGSDFAAMLQGARDVARGSDLYGPALRFLAHGHLREILTMPVTPYVYPPPLAVALRPLTYLTSDQALFAWDVFNVTMVGVLFITLIRLTRARTIAQMFLVGSIYGFFPLNMGLGTGQIDSTIALALLGVVCLFRAEMVVRAGMVLGIIVLIKPTLAIAVVYFVVRRSWPTVASFLATALCGLILSIAAVGVPMLIEYRRVSEGWANTFGALPLNQSLHGMVIRLLSARPDATPEGLALGIASSLEVTLPLVAVALVIWLLRGHREPGDIATSALQFYASLGVLLTASPFTEDTHLTWLLPGVAILFVVMTKDVQWRPWHAVAVCSYLAIASPVTQYVQWHVNATKPQQFLTDIDCLALVLLCAVQCSVSFRHRRRTVRLRQDERAHISGRQARSLRAPAAL